MVWKTALWVKSFIPSLYKDFWSWRSKFLFYIIFSCFADQHDVRGFINQLPIKVRYALMKIYRIIRDFFPNGKTPPPCWEKFPNNPIISYEGVLHLEKRTQLSSWIEAKLHLRGVFLLDTTDTSQQITLLHWASNFLGDWCNKPFSCLSIECSSQ